jgi:hypothetical protein
VVAAAAPNAAKAVAASMRRKKDSRVMRFLPWNPFWPAIAAGRAQGAHPAATDVER